MTESVDFTSFVARAHDEMGEDYDDITDPWYGHLYDSIHRFLIQHLPPGARRALDVGCGTGLQSCLAARSGVDVDGFDLSETLVELARRKVDRMVDPNSKVWDPYPEDVVLAADALRGERTLGSLSFWIGDVNEASAWRSDGYDVVVCCGSVLSFVEEHVHALHRIRDSLKPGGILILEVEQRLNLDVLWSLCDVVTGGRVGLDADRSDVRSLLFSHPSNHVRTTFPFPMSDGTEVALPLRLFARSTLIKEAMDVGLDLCAERGVHVLTNVFPSVWLHGGHVSPGIQRVARLLGRVEDRVAHVPGIRGLGCSWVAAFRRA